MIRKIVIKLLPQILFLSLLTASLPFDQASAEKNSYKFPQSYLDRDDIWKMIADDMDLETYSHNSNVQKQIQWFLKHPQSLQTRTQNAEPYIYYVTQEVKKRGMPLELALLPMVESNYNPNRTSSAQAVGLWQLMPTTARDLGMLMNVWYDGRRDIVASTHVALDYLQHLHDYFNSWPLAFAAYNAGIGTVNKAIQQNRIAGRSTNYWALNLPQQTRNYVPKLIAIAIILSHPERFKMPVQKVRNIPYFTRVQVSKPLSLHQAASLLNTNTSNMKKLNPAFKEMHPVPVPSYHLLIPVQKLDHFKQNIAAFQKESDV